MKIKATIYTNSEFGIGINSHEVWLHEHGTRKYAQYDNAPYAVFTVKRRRNKSQIIKGYKPYILIVEGWNQPKPGSGMIDLGNGTSKSRYLSCDDRYQTDFDSQIDSMIESGQVKVIADYRYTKQ